MIISLWLYFLWIVAISTFMRAQFKGGLVNCMIVGGSGCVLVAMLYVIVFVGAYYIPKSIQNKANIQKLKSIYRTANIWGIYVSIGGFFMLSLSVLLLDRDKIRAFRLAWLIIAVSLFFVTILILCMQTYRRVSAAVRTFALQEKNEVLFAPTAEQEENQQ